MGTANAVMVKDIDKSNLSGDYASAYAQAEELLDEQEGEPSFDLVYGIAAYGTGRLYEAVFALERVVHAEPENMRARFVLAKAYVDLGNTEAARKQLRIVQSNNPPADIAADVAALLAQIGATGDKKTTFLGYVDAYLGHDNNINRATTDRTVTFPTSASDLILGSESRQQSDAYRALGAGVQVYQPLKGQLGLIGSATVSDKDNFSSDDFDETVYKLKGGLNQQVENHNFRVLFQGQNYYLSGSTYSRILGASGDWLMKGEGGWDYGAGLIYNELEYPGRDYLDVDQFYIHGSIRKRMGRAYHSVGAMLGEEDAEESNSDQNARESMILFYDYNLYVNARHSLQTRVLYNDNERKDEDPSFMKTRNEDYVSATFAWYWQLSEFLQMRSRLAYSENDSNISLYSYDRTYAETGLRYTF